MVCPPPKKVGLITLGMELKMTIVEKKEKEYGH